jgi:hypothetical protein
VILPGRARDARRGVGRGSPRPRGRAGPYRSTIWLAVKFALECDYLNGQTIDVDGGLQM